MTHPLSTDLRQHTLAAVASGMTRRAAASRFGIFPSSVIRWVAEWRASGRDHALMQGDTSLVELADRLATKHGVRFAPSTIWRGLDRHTMTVKKTAHASEQTQPDVAARREVWFENQPDLDPEFLVFIDETAVFTKMVRLRGTRCRMPVPHWHWNMTTFIGCLRLSGRTAPMMLTGPMTGE